MNTIPLPIPSPVWQALRWSPVIPSQVEPDPSALTSQTRNSALMARITHMNTRRRRRCGCGAGGWGCWVGHPGGAPEPGGCPALGGCPWYDCCCGGAQPSGGCDTTLPPVIGCRIPISSKRASQTLSRRIDTTLTTGQRISQIDQRCPEGTRSMPAFRSVASVLVRFVRTFSTNSRPACGRLPAAAVLARQHQPATR
jgi:hypothetical protein